jgi:hypothetical protein
MRRPIAGCDATGRSSGKLTGHAGQLARPPEGKSWMRLTRELLESSAWQALSINGRRFIEFLLCEQMNHAARENGGLAVPYQQLREWGMPADCILPAIEKTIRLESDSK